MGINTVWKYVWNPMGYGPETFTLSTQKMRVGDFIFLPHTYFKTEGFSIALVNSSTSSRIPLIEGVDFAFDGKDDGLSALAGYPVYTRIKLLKTKTINQTLEIVCNFIGDVLDPKLFNQELHQQADVVHNSVEVKSIKAQTGEINNLKVNSSFELSSLGSFTRKIVTFFAQKLQLDSDKLEITPGVIQTSEPSFILKTPDNFFKYSPDTKRWVVYNPRNGEEVPLCYFYKNFLKQRPYGLPVVLAGDPGALTFVDWITIDPENKTFVVKRISTEILEARVIRNLQKIYLEAEGEIKIGDSFIIKITEDGVNIGNKILLTDQQIIINGLIIDKEFLTLIDTLKTLPEFVRRKMNTFSTTLETLSATQLEKQKNQEK